MKKKLVWIVLAILIFLLAENVFIGYRFSWGLFKSLGDVRMAKIPGNSPDYGMASLETVPDSPLAGKKVLFLGSSVTYGAASLQEGIPEYFARRLGCDVTKEAVSGTTLADTGSSSYVQRLLNRVPADTPYALAVIQLSTNDATKKLPLGQVDPEQRDGFDTSTVLGAMEFIISYCRNTWDCPVLFYTNARYDSAEYAAMVEMLPALQEKWGIGVLDLWHDDAFNAITDAERALYMNDKIHPTKAGYREWWCPEMERQLLAFLAENG